MKQVGGNHYEGMEVQPIHLINKYNLTYIEGNILKYVMRHEFKNGVEDLDKAISYVTMLCKLPLAHCKWWYSFVKPHYIKTYEQDVLPLEVDIIVSLLLHARCEKLDLVTLSDRIYTLKLNFKETK